MPTTNAKWMIGTKGDAVRRRITIDRAKSNVPTGVTITKAWLTVKADEADADPGLIQKEVTTTNVSGTGQIENDGTGDVDFVVRFDLLRADTILIGTIDDATQRRRYDVQVLASDGNPYTVENGLVYCLRPEVTAATS